MPKIPMRAWLGIGAFVLFGAVLAYLARVNYLLFHSLVELFSIMVGFVIGVVAWYTFRFSRNHFLAFLGIAYPAVAFIDLVHTLAYRGMGVFPLDANLPTQLWIAARAMEALVLLAAPFYLTHPLHPRHTLAGFMAATSALLLLIGNDWFPTMYVEGQGLTQTKILSEYLIVGIIALAGLHLWRRRERLDAGIRWLLTGALGMTMLAELSFTFYVGVYDASNLVGHLAKLGSFWLVFLGLARTSLQEPFRILSRNSTTYDAIPEEIVVVDQHGLIRQINRRVEQRLGSQATIGHAVHPLFHGASGPGECPVCAAIAEGREGSFELSDAGGRWRLLTLAAIRDPQSPRGMVQTVRDISELKQAQVSLQHLNRALRAISASNRTLIQAGSEEALIADVCRICVDRGGYRLAWVGFPDEGPARLIVPVAWAGAEQGYLSAVRFSWGDNPWSEGPAGLALRSGARSVVNDIATDPRYARWREPALERGFAATMAFPLRSRDGQTFGMLAIYSDEANTFTDEEVEILEELAGDLAYGIEAQRAGTAREAAESRAEHWYRSLAGVLRETVEAVSGMVEMRDPYTAGHQRRVAQLAVAIGRELKLDPQRLEGLMIGGLLHDTGKINVPSEILARPGRISELEFNMIKEHSRAGYELLKGISFPWPIAEMVHQHHERLDGSGYPRGLSGDQILLEARILAVADVVEAMCSHRPYRPARGIEAGLGEIETQAGTKLDAEAVAACTRLFRERRFNWEEPAARAASA